MCLSRSMARKKPITMHATRNSTVKVTVLRRSQRNRSVGTVLKSRAKLRNPTKLKFGSNESHFVSEAKPVKPMKP